MKFVLAIEDDKGRSSLFIGDDGTVYTLAEAIDLAKKGQASGLQVATRNGVSYLRASRSRIGIPALQDISVSSKSILSIDNSTTNVFSRTQFRPFWDFYRDQLEKRAAQGDLVVSVDGQPFDTMSHVHSTLLPYRENIFSAGGKFTIDPYLLAAIFVDETVRLAPFEEIRDKLAIRVLGVDYSVGIGQVTIETARGLIRDGYYNPNPEDSALNREQISKASRRLLLSYVTDSKHNVYFAAAKLRSMIDEWKRAAHIDLDPVIIATLYHLRHRIPHPDPKSDTRGEQIVNEFEPLARQILS